MGEKVRKPHLLAIAVWPKPAPFFAAIRIVALNIERREMTPGQKAMAVAFIYPDPERGRGKKDPARKETDTGSFSYSRLKVARQIIRHSRELAEEVLSGVTKLDEALQKVKAAKTCELLDEYDARGEHRRTVGDHGSSQEQAARGAGLSEHQQLQAVRVSRVPAAEFEAMVESDNPPTVTELNPRVGISKGPGFATGAFMA